MWLPRTRSLGEQLRYVESRTVVHTSGRPAGLAWSSQEEILYVADIDRGLVAVDVARGLDRVVVSEFQGRFWRILYLVLFYFYEDKDRFDVLLICFFYFCSSPLFSRFRKLQFPNGVDIDNEGIVYFTDATRHRPVK